MQTNVPLQHTAHMNLLLAVAQCSVSKLNNTIVHESSHFHIQKQRLGYAVNVVKEIKMAFQELTYSSALIEEVRNEY